MFMFGLEINELVITKWLPMQQSVLLDELASYPLTSLQQTFYRAAVKQWIQEKETSKINEKDIYIRQILMSRHTLGDKEKKR